MQVFDHLFNSLLALIPNPPDPESLMGKNVVLGKRVLNDIKFKLVRVLGVNAGVGTCGNAPELRLTSFLTDAARCLS